MSISPITNEYDPTAQRPLLSVELVMLYEPQQESDWHYCHHPHITYFNGRFHAIWSNGRRHEDDLGQRVLTASSANFAEWTTPTPLMDATWGKHSELVLTAGGFHQHAGQLVAYVGQWEYAADAIQNNERPARSIAHQDTDLLALTTIDGVHWSPPRSLRVPLVPNHGPQPTRSGRLILSGNIMFPYSDEPSGLAGWHLTGIYPPDLPNVWDDPEYHGTLARIMNWPIGVCEGSFYQTADGVLHMLLRSDEKRLWVTESHDDGATWSTPQPTHFTDNRTKFHLGMLPDGRFYYVGSPDPDGERCPLVLSLSEDGVHFRQHYLLGDTNYARKFPGLHKGGVYGYPHTLVRDGYLHVIVSIRKERVAVLRTPLANL